LIAGHVYRFRWYAHAAVVAGAVLLGYVFNFIRLCVLVLYYVVALHVTSLQSKAEMADYVIGAVLFLIGTILLLHVVTHLSESPAQGKSPAISVFSSQPVQASFYGFFAAMLGVVLFGCFGLARAYAHTHSSRFVALMSEQKVPGQFPERIGSYSLVRTWSESMFAGPLIYHWADYAPMDGGAHVALGISPVLGSHDTVLCHSARGEEPLWRDQLTLPTAGGPSISFTGLFFNTGATQSLEANTICNGRSCGEFSNDRMHFGLIYSKPAGPTLLTQDPQRPIPILLKAETIDTVLPAEVARQQMIDALRSFVAAADLNSLTQPYRRP
jgi:exosortase J